MTLHDLNQKCARYLSFKPLARDPGAVLIDAHTVFFGSATIFYLAILFLKAPAWLLFVAIAASAVIAIAVTVVGFPGESHRSNTVVANTAALLVIVAVAAAFSLNIAVVNADDFNFLHRALFQLYHLREPFSRTTDFLDLTAQPISNAHLLSGLEPIYVTLGYGLGADPLWFFDNVVPAWHLTLFGLASLALYRQIGLTQTPRFAALVTIILFCCLDLRAGRSYGNVLFFMNDGKVILWSFWVVCALFYSLRYVERPSIYNYVVLFFCHCGAVGYSGSGTYVSPAFAAAVGLSVLVGGLPLVGTRDGWRPRVDRVAALGCVSLFPLILGGTIAFGLLPLPQNLRVWQDGFPAYWLDNLALLSRGPLDTARIFLSVLLPWLVLKIYYARFFTLYSIALVALLFNSVSGPAIMHIVLPASYWRLGFLFPHLIFVGLIGAMAVRAFSGRDAIWRAAWFWHSCLLLALVVLLAGPLKNSQAMLHAYGMLFIKNSAAPRLSFEALTFAYRIHQWVAGRLLLTGETFGSTLGQVSPTSQFLWNRGAEHLLQGTVSPESIADRAALAVSAERCELADVSNLAEAATTFDVPIFVLGPSARCAAFAHELAAQLGPAWSIADSDVLFALVTRLP